MATLADVAARAGVSVSAVSRVLRDAPGARVGLEARQRIHRAADDLGYRPNAAARALKSARTGVLALIVPDLTNAIFSELMAGVEERAAERDYSVLLARAEGFDRPRESLDRLFGEGRIDGVLIQVGDAVDLEELHDVLDGTLPAVLVNSRRGDRVGSVMLDDGAASAVAVRHLVELGHRRIAFAGGLRDNVSARRREEGFRTAMSDAGLEVDERAITSLGYEPRQGRAAIAALVDGGARPTAVVVANVNAALGALLEARMRGIAVPEDLSIVAIHDSWPAEMTWPPITTVRMPLRRLGADAVDAIVERLHDGAIHHRVTADPPPVLVARASTAPVTADSPAS